MNAITISMVANEIANDITPMELAEMEVQSHIDRWREYYEIYAMRLRMQNDWELECFRGCLRYGIEPCPVNLVNIPEFDEWLVECQSNINDNNLACSFRNNIFNRVINSREIVEAFNMAA